MKLATFLIAISSAIASANATESCSIQALFLFATPNSIECTFETGYASVLLTIPTKNQLKKVCGNDACQRFFGQLNTAFPRECDFFGKPFRESFLDKIAVACAPPTTAPPATTKPPPVPTTTVPATPKPTPPTPEPTTTAPATTTPAPEPTKPVPTRPTMAPIPTTPGPEPIAEPTVEPTAEPTPEPIPEPTPEVTTTPATKPPYPTSTRPSVPSPSPPTQSPSPTTKPPPPPLPTPSLTAPDASATCSLTAPAKCLRKFISVDIYDNDITSFFYVKGSNDCCELCANTAGCKAYSYSKWDTRCYVKDVISGFTMNTNFVSGLVN